MWRTSGSERGFSLVEFLVYMTLVVVLLTFSAQVLFSMRRSATRMELATSARQTARQAVEYIARYVRGASDMLDQPVTNPLSILVWLASGGGVGGGAVPVQVSYNNVTDPTLADPGTDIIVLAVPANGQFVPLDHWPGYLHAADAWWQFDLACPDSAANLALFKQLTGAHIEGNKEVSVPVLVRDGNGRFGFYQIVNYLDGANSGNCGATPPTIHVVANPGLSGGLNPPGGQPNLSGDVEMVTGPRYVSFRVRGGWLEQKEGVFNPNTDNPGTSFVQVLPDVEDFQVAWIYADGTIWNNTPSHQLPTAGNVPQQAALNFGASPGQYDVVNVMGLRITVTARSPDEVTWEPEPGRFFRPQAEDHPAGAARDRFYHRRATQVVMIRNRSLGR